MYTPNNALLPVIVFGELLYGAANSTRPQENEQATRKFFDHVPNLQVVNWAR